MSEFRPDLEQDRGVSRWALILSVALVGALVFSLVVFNSLYGRPNYNVGLYDTAKPVATVSYGPAKWTPHGPPAKLSDRDMVAIGRAEEGFLLYAPRAVVQGGGGGPATGTLPTGYSQLYMRTRDGTYQPLIRKQ